MAIYIPKSYTSYGTTYSVQSSAVKAAQSETAEAQTTAADKADEKQTSLQNLIDSRNKAMQEAKEQLEQFREQQKQAQEQSKKMNDYGKLLKVAMRIMNGDKVPYQDKRALMEKMPDLYKQSEMFKRTNNKRPIKYKSEFKDEDKSYNSTLKKALQGYSKQDANIDFIMSMLG